MDGLSIILLPKYLDGLTPNIINWTISPLTKSLNQSTLSAFHYNPFKILSMTSAIALFNLFKRTNQLKLFLKIY